ncbi:type IV pilus twitching motility protein PilT [Bordetella bronchiseptica]|uniref:type IV pilus twitching motility protein PilT n=1 Tax=Bordetella bronchiseptica TaxID=518 RepID=UPI003EDB9F7F
MTIDELLALTVARGASDLHLSAGLPPMLRINGDVVRQDVAALTPDALRAMIHQLMQPAQREEYETRQELDFSIDVEGLARFRVNAFNQQRGPAAVLRTIPSAIRTLDELGCPASFKELVRQPQGLILVTGPTGSGKSTTLAAMIDHLNREGEHHILTIEDPIEFVHPSRRSLVNQREVGRDTHSFSTALRSALREDPDIILVGELRDLETMRLAMTAAETGHLVFATLHTNSAAKTVDRIIDVFPAGEKSMIRSMLSESLRAVIAQVLLKQEGGGRCAAWEIMVGTPAIRNLIREDKIAQMVSSIQTGQAHGMQTLDQALQDLLRKKLISAEQALAYARDRRSLGL